MAVKVAQLTEKQVLKKLNIPDFRHLSKDKIMTFFSMLPNMDPEVAKKAIEQFPTYAGTVKEIVSEYKGFLEKALSDNAESVQSYYAICNSILNTLSNMLEQDDLSFDEKKYIIDQMLVVESRVRQKDTENKKHQLKIVGWVSVVTHPKGQPFTIPEFPRYSAEVRGFCCLRETC
ncbi:hypothetical protein [uncultured Ruminococcus sp.]|uniref:hypothetical protein n=1 Tax=uncultured Ruminococcus sp. TaxID=165186 RepID=UPI0025E2BD3C|nr:hypothetical protein [uncultured Ruminococcus sp.]